jgi:hypothetical protein
MPAGVSLVDLGEHRLKDLDRPEVLRQLVVDDLPATFPPLRTLDVPTNLPTQLTTFLGREAEIDEVLRLVDEGRSDLTGPGGTGKRGSPSGRRGPRPPPTGSGSWPSARPPSLSSSRRPSPRSSACPIAADAIPSPASSTSRRSPDAAILDNFEQVLAAPDSSARPSAPGMTLRSLSPVVRAPPLRGARVPGPALDLPGHLPALAALPARPSRRSWSGRGRCAQVLRHGENAWLSPDLLPPRRPAGHRARGGSHRLLTPQAILARFGELSLLAGGRATRHLPSVRSGAIA